MARRSSVTWEDAGGAESDSDGGNNPTPYEEIMGMVSRGEDTDEGGGAAALGSRLVLFRRWLSNEAGIVVHPSVCIVNGEATDGTKNAPVLTFGPPQSSTSSSQPASGPAGSGRCGMVDHEADRSLYDRTMGCQVRVARELKKDEVMMEVPKAAMITPDLVATSDAGRAVLACCSSFEGVGGSGDDATPGFWDAFENTVKSEKKFADKVGLSNGTQLLVKILQERKKAETVIKKAEGALDNAERKLNGHPGRRKARMIAQDPSLAPRVKLAPRGTISTRAPIIAFLLHQRFSNAVSPPVASSADLIGENFREPPSSDAVNNKENGKKRCVRPESAAAVVPRRMPPADSPSTFGPYARTLPSAIPLPICWKRNELALLAGCIPGVPLLQDVAARTLQLTSDLISLVEAGILHRFPDVFPRGLITWDRWMWAASVYTSRVFPVSCYLNKGEKSATNHELSREVRSPTEVWNELGVMIPLLDMLNHENEAAQITWESPTGKIQSQPGVKVENADEVVMEHPRAVMHKRVKKSSQVYNNYGIESNQTLMLQYGFALMNNPADEVTIGWGLMDGVGNVPPPSDYDLVCDDPPGQLDKVGDPGSVHESTAQMKTEKHLVFESVDPLCIKAWWTESRLLLLEKEALMTEAFLSNLKKGKKMTALAYSDGTYHPIFLTAAVIATMPPREVRKFASASASPPGGGGHSVSLSKRHQRCLRHYLCFVFTRKLEKLLQSLNNGLKDHFNNSQLWTKASLGGLQYGGSDSPESGGGEDPAVIGWQSFFDSYAYSATMEVEKRYYAMGPDSCVLTLYDGHLRSLQASIDAVSTQSQFEEGVFRQLRDLGFVVSEDDSDNDDLSVDSVGEKTTEEQKGSDENADVVSQRHPDNSSGFARAEEPAPNGSLPVSAKSEPSDDKTGSSMLQPRQKPDQPSPSGPNKSNGGDRNRNRRNRKKGERPPAIKLHIGNLSYNTKPSELFDFFANMYGRENVLECHIPTERETGKSRGFGFVTMPEGSAVQALHSNRQHEIEGRVLKVAESNTAGAGKTNRGGHVGGSLASDRCSTCGYRPKYCTCAVPCVPGGGAMMGGHPPPVDDMYGPGPVPMMDLHDYGMHYGRPPPDFGGHNRSRSWGNNRGRPSYSRSPSPRGGHAGRTEGGHSRHRDSRPYDRGYRDYRGGGGRVYSRSRSRSYSRGRDRDRDRDKRDRDRGRGNDRSRESRSGARRSNRDAGSSATWGGRSSRGSRYSRSRSRSRSGSRSRSRSYSKGPQSRRGGDRERKVSGGSGGTEMAIPRGRSRSRSSSIPPPQSRREGGSASDRKRESQSRKRSRSRSRGRSSRRKRSSKKEVSKRHARSKSRSRSNSRSRSWSED